MNKIRALIVDDEPLARLGLVLRLEKYEDVEIVGECANGSEALELINELEPNLIFLDIEMPGMDGFEVVRRMQADNMGLVVFVTAFDQYAVDAFEVHAVDYVLKPVEDKRLRLAVDRVRSRLTNQGVLSDKQQLMDLIANITGEARDRVSELLKNGGFNANNYPEKIPIKNNGETILVPCKDIDWIEAAGDYMCIHACDQVHILRSTMKELEAKLHPTTFQRIHRSTIVNLDRVEKVNSHLNGEYFLTLKDGSQLKMSRSYKDRIKHII